MLTFWKFWVDKGVRLVYMWKFTIQNVQEFIYIFIITNIIKLDILYIAVSLMYLGAKNNNTINDLYDII